LACKKGFSLISAHANTIYGGESSVLFSLKVTFLHATPIHGAIVLAYPSDYPINLYEPGVECQILSPLLINSNNNNNLYNRFLCKIITQTSISITAKDDKNFSLSPNLISEND